MGHTAGAPPSALASRTVVPPFLVAGLLTTLITGLLTVAPSQAWACSCAPSTDHRHLSRADVAFIGTGLTRRPPAVGRDGVMSSLDPATYVFAVSAVLKGRVGPRQEVISPQFGASCGIEIPLGRPVVVFGQREGSRPVRPAPDQLVASLCNGTRALSERPLAPAVLGRGRPPVDEARRLSERDPAGDRKAAETARAEAAARSPRFDLLVSAALVLAITSGLAAALIRHRRAGGGRRLA